MNNRSHYLGAFLVIEVRVRDSQAAYSRCPSGHQDSGPFCRQCGLPVSIEWAPVKEYPTHIYQLLSADDEETLSVITPAHMFGTGTIIASANSRAGVWMVIDRDTRGQPIRGFPTSLEIEALKDDLWNLPAVQALREHPDVVSVHVNAGYVEDAEY